VSRLRQVPRAEVADPLTLAVYDHRFPGRCPVAEPGTDDGTRGDFWTTYALVPDVLAHAVGGFLLYQSSDRVLPATWRELAQLRVGVLVGSAFVARQHRRAAQMAGCSAAAMAAASALGPRPASGEAEVEIVLDYVDALVLDLGTVDPATSAQLHELLGDVGMLELTYIATLYLAHAVACKALELEDDAPEVAL